MIVFFAEYDEFCMESLQDAIKSIHEKGLQNFPSITVHSDFIVDEFQRKWDDINLYDFANLEG